MLDEGLTCSKLFQPFPKTNVANIGFREKLEKSKVSPPLPVNSYIYRERVWLQVPIKGKFFSSSQTEESKNIGENGGQQFG
jgi:hypothetical protein